jgi:hypothetical protein
MATPMGKESSLLSVTGSSARLESSSSQDSQLICKKQKKKSVWLELCTGSPSINQIKNKKDTMRGLVFCVDWRTLISRKIVENP